MADDYSNFIQVIFYNILGGSKNCKDRDVIVKKKLRKQEVIGMVICSTA